ncbi:MAG: hypothetical protein HZR80_19295 [Candidatus Heimdallarchaeota archaeon]
MDIWIIYLIIICLSVVLWLFSFFSIWKTKRYATILFDLLPFYPLLAIVGYIAIITCSILWLDFLGWIFPLVFGMLIAILLVYLSIKWIKGYRLKVYVEFLVKLKDDKYSVKTLSDYFVHKKIDPEMVNVFIRHDIDLSLRRFSKMIEIEKEKGIKSTSMIRLHSEKYSFEKALPLIKQLNAEGYEIGYHYEVLAQTKGNKEQAIQLFTQELAELREIVPIAVVAAHGDKYKNRDIWSLLNQKELNVYSAYDMKRDMYLSDAGGYDFTRRYGHHLFEELDKAKKGDVVQILIHADWWF